MPFFNPRKFLIFYWYLNIWLFNQNMTFLPPFMHHIFYFSVHLCFLLFLSKNIHSWSKSINYTLLYFLATWQKSCVTPCNDCCIIVFFHWIFRLVQEKWSRASEEATVKSAISCLNYIVRQFRSDDYIINPDAKKNYLKKIFFGLQSLKGLFTT